MTQKIVFDFQGFKDLYNMFIIKELAGFDGIKFTQSLNHLTLLLLYLKICFLHRVGLFETTTASIGKQDLPHIHRMKTF